VRAGIEMGLDRVATAVLSRALLLAPGRIRKTLEGAQREGLVVRAPTSWQLSMGVLRMLHRMWTRPESIGLSVDNPVRAGLGARLMSIRPVRGPLLLGIGAVQPWDLTGLLASRDKLIRHLVGTHHDRRQFAYDLEILRLYPQGLEALREEVGAIVEGRHALAHLFRVTCVYENYHENLLAAVDGALAGDLGLDAGESEDPDISFAAYLEWCLRQPESVGKAIAKWRRSPAREGREAHANGSAA